tara:strand:+ start:1726 stop:2166 length:441 start_codon:yes stop_codon:yes gene_type:complete
MKNIEMFYLNRQHQEIIESHIGKIKKLMYYATENVDSGKYQSFLDILNSIYLYSNNFYSSVLERSDDDSGTIAEFLFLVPNMCFYSAIGFLTALKDGKNDSEIKDYLERVGVVSESATGELADILIDEQEKKEYIKELINIKTNQN